MFGDTNTKISEENKVNNFNTQPQPHQMEENKQLEVKPEGLNYQGLKLSEIKPEEIKPNEIKSEEIKNNEDIEDNPDTDTELENTDINEFLPDVDEASLIQEINTIKFLTDPIRFNGIIYEGIQLILKKIVAIEEKIVKMEERIIGNKK